MMTKVLTALSLLLLSVTACYADVGHGYGYCQQGGHTVLTASVSSTNKVQESYPSCTVKVFLTGTTTLATLFSDPAGTISLSNPFTADVHGYYSFYTAFATYDINFSGSTITVPFTLGGVPIGVGGGGGGTPAGAVGSLQYNNSGVFGGVGLGTTTQVYHGNASGVGSFGSVNLATDVTGNLSTSNLTGTLQAAQFPALTGDVTTTAGNLATTLGTLGTSGSCGDATHSCTLTIDTKGRISVHNNTSIASAGGSTATSIIAGLFSAIPATCSAGDVYFATDKPFLQQLYLCSTTNHWLPYIQLDASGGLVDATGQISVDQTKVPRLDAGFSNAWHSDNYYGATVYPSVIGGTISLPESLVSSLPPASVYPAREFVVEDGQNASDCTVGGGATPSLCRSNGTVWQPINGGANLGLSNLGTTSINTALLPQTGRDLGASFTPWRNLYLYGSGSYGGGNYFQLTGNPTAARVVTLPDASITVGNSVASGTTGLRTDPIAAGACSANVAISRSGVASSDAFAWSFAGDPTGVTGYGAGGLTVVAYVLTDLVEFKVCNPTAASITPGTVAVNYRVMR